MSTGILAPVHTTIVAVFEDRASARAAIENLERAGFSDEQIGFAGPDLGIQSSKRQETNVENGVGMGAAIGAAAGGAAGLVMGVGMLTPLGPAFVGGALAAWLLSAGAGAATGALVGTLISLGVSEDEARWYERELKSGRTIVTLHNADERAVDARAILRHHGATIREPSDIGTYGTGLPATPY